MLIGRVFFRRPVTHALTIRQRHLETEVCCILHTFSTGLKLGDYEPIIKIYTRLLLHFAFDCFLFLFLVVHHCLLE